MLKTTMESIGYAPTAVMSSAELGTYIELLLLLTADVIQDNAFSMSLLLIIGFSQFSPGGRQATCAKSYRSVGFTSMNAYCEG